MAHPLSESAGSIMVKNVPVTKESATVAQVLHLLSKDNWDDIHSVVVISDHGFLLGIVPIHSLLISTKEKLIKHIMKKVPFSVHPSLDQEQVVIQAIHNDVQFVPVVDNENRFLGAVTADQIIDILHDEHLEDLLHTSGIHGDIEHMSDLVKARVQSLVLIRFPWLVVGLVIAFLASFFISQFETFLNHNVAIAFFISMVAYMSGAINTQSQLIFIRALTVMRFNIASYLVREFFIGVIIGGSIGLIAGIGAYLLSKDFLVALTVGTALLISMGISTLIACVVPLVLRAWGKDPAIGSGPFATAIQDLVSITIYFTVSLLILGGL
ncbi:MAG TPA: magnesium transporter [Patescibacteria group bacterium]|nr:magnesium transporter [Patescibacteria group bacterium]